MPDMTREELRAHLDARPSFESTISSFETKLQGQRGLSDEKFDKVSESLNDKFGSVASDIVTTRWIIGVIIALAAIFVAALNYWGASGA